MEKKCCVVKKMFSSFSKPFFYSNGKAQNMPEVAGRLVDVSVKFFVCLSIDTVADACEFFLCITIRAPPSIHVQIVLEV